MSNSAVDAAPVHHPDNHWGPFADDPCSATLDGVPREIWQEAVRRAERSRLARSGAFVSSAAIPQSGRLEGAAGDQPQHAGEDED